MRVIPKADNFYCFKLKLCNFTEPVQQFLANSPLIFRHGKSLCGFVFLNKARPVTISELSDHYKVNYTDGLDKLYIASASGFAEQRDHGGSPALPHLELVDMSQTSFDQWLRGLTASARPAI